MATSPNVVLVPLNLPVKTISGAFLVYIPYSGTALAIPDLVSAKVDVKFDSLVTGLPYAKDGKLRALAAAQPALPRWCGQTTISGKPSSPSARLRWSSLVKVAGPFNHVACLFFSVFSPIAQGNAK